MSTTADRRPSQQAGADATREYFGAATVYAAGAVLYFLAREVFDMDFLASPLFYGVMLLVASYFRPRLLASAVVLICWGIAVLADGNGPLEEGRTASVHTFGFGVGALLCLLLRRWIPERVALESLAIIMVVVGLWYYFVHDFSVLEDAWLWSAVFLASAAALVVVGLRVRTANGARA
ncbi:MAG: hypothetical protein ACRDJE_28020 [Dehalococcoidia bacterium]